MNKKYFINTYGCQMNVHESEKLAGVLKNLGYEEALAESEADVIIFNTCCIREGAEQRIFGNIGALKKQKQQNPNLIIAVCGCMSQQKGIADTIKAKFPFVNVVLGTHNIHKFEEYLLNNINSHKKVYDVWDKEQQIVENSPIYRTSKNNAWVNINYGCNNFCTYCIVPYVRGRERSRKPEDIIAEVTELVNSKNYKTITLLGQNVNSYGSDFGADNINFAKLLQELCRIEGDFRLRFLTSHPKDLSDEVIDVIANNYKISKNIHLPVQSGSTNILKSMNRSYTAEHYIKLVDKIRAKIKNVTLTTDILVGFPGETDKDFENTINLIKYCKFINLYAFMFSKRKGTPAEKMDNQVPAEIKRKRVNEVLAAAKQISKNANEEFLGKTVEVFDSHTDWGKLVEFEEWGAPPANSFVNVQITKVTAKKLIGKIT